MASNGVLGMMALAVFAGFVVLAAAVSVLGRGRSAAGRSLFGRAGGRRPDRSREPDPSETDQTDRAVHADHAVHAELERLRTLAHSSQDVVIELDEQGFILFASDNVATFSSQSPGELVGLNVSDFWHFMPNSLVAQSIRDHGKITQEAIDSTEQPAIQRATMADGTQRWLESTATCYRNLGNQLRILVRTRDVTERIEHEERTRQSELRLNRAERMAKLGTWEYWPQEGRLTWSDHMFRLHGLEPIRGEIPLDLGRSLTFPEDLEKLDRTMWNVQPAAEARYRIRRADNGETRSLATRREVARDADGNVVRITGTSRDITKQLALEKTIQRDQRNFRLFFESNVVPIFYPQRDGLVTEANDAFLSLLGYTANDLPLAWEGVTPPGALERDEIAREEIERTGVAEPYEMEFVAKSGTSIPMLVRSAQLEPGVDVVVAVDLSERKRAEAYIDQYQRKLEETIAERTHELMKSRDRLIENDRLAAVGTLAAGVAHQINNPIGAILNSAEFALMCRDHDNRDTEFEHALNINLAEARRCARIVKSMLLFSRDEPTARWPEDLGDVIRRAHRAIAPYAADRFACVELHSDPSPIQALISPIEIEQAIVNVLRNAIESREKGASISLTWTRRKKFAEIEVLDDGRGIEESQLDRLFEPFYSTRTREGGTGLGLSVAHGIVTDHGGEIRVGSILGEGTRVVILLPLTE